MFWKGAMKTLHTKEKEQFKKLFGQEGIDRFDDRLKVVEAFLQIEGHLTAVEVHRHLEGQGATLSPDFVRETLKLMCQLGFARRSRFGNGEVRYEHLHLGQHHDHMICTKCSRIYEFQNDQLEALQIQIAAARGFHLLQHRMELYGICAECLKERVDRMPLDMARPGERLTIIDFIGGAGARMRLMTMGLRVGDRIEVITNISEGQIAVALENRRLVLGRGLSQKIIVQPDRATPGRPLSHNAEE
jgi:Fur family ferric uptake transcriptional regulator